jgi:site-specific DNA-methyltransferase (adenine-specific)
MIEQFLNKVFHCDALELLRKLPAASIDAVIMDPMFGTSQNFEYDWGVDPAKGDPVKHWQYHEPIYRDCLRVLKPGGVLAWGQGGKFAPYFPKWFGTHRVWTVTRVTDTFCFGFAGRDSVWIVQTREKQPIPFPNIDALVMCSRAKYVLLKKLHPCPKPVEELALLISSLTQPGQILLDCFCGSGSTLVAAKTLNRHWIGCDRSRRYCQIAMKRLDG